MKKNNLIRSIKNLIFEGEETASGNDYKSGDKILRIESLTEGSVVNEINEDGELVEVADGTYPLEGEDKSVVVENSHIVEVIVNEEEETPAEDEDFEGEEDGDEEETPEYQYDKLIDGRTIRANAFTAGNIVEVVEEDGNYIIEEGEHELENGEVLSIDEDGMIVEKLPVEEEEVTPAEEAFSKRADQWFEKKINSKDFKSLLVKFSTSMKKIETLEKENKILKQRFNKIAGKPSTTSVNKKVDFSKSSKQDRLKFFGK